MRKKRVCDYTEEQIQWISEHLTGWNNRKEFTDAFNKEFNTDKKTQTLTNFTYKNGITVYTKKNTVQVYTEEQNNWIIENFSKYSDYVSMVKDYNDLFGCNKTNGAMRRKCVNLGLVTDNPRKKSDNKKKYRVTKSNGGRFVKCQVGRNGLPVGTIRYNSDGRPFIKVMDCNGQAGVEYGGHNYKEPFWKPLQKKIWEDVNGEVPDGYVVCSLNGNPNDTNIENIGIIQKKYTTMMAKNGWWSSNKVITKTGIKWCELKGLLIRSRKDVRKDEKIS